MEISSLGLLMLVALAAVCGAIAKAVVGFRRGGLMASIGLGFMGGLTGVIVARVTDLPTLLTFSLGGVVFPFVWALLGTVLLVMAVAAMHGATHRRRAP